MIWYSLVHSLLRLRVEETKKPQVKNQCSLKGRFGKGQYLHLAQLEKDVVTCEAKAWNAECRITRVGQAADLCTLHLVQANPPFAMTNFFLVEIRSCHSSADVPTAACTLV